MATNLQDVMNGIKSYIEDNYGTYITLNNTANGDDADSITDMREVAGGFDITFKSNQYPIMSLEFDEIELATEDESLGSENLRATILCMITDRASSKENGSEKGTRYADSIRDLFLADPTAEGAVQCAFIDFYEIFNPGDVNKIITVARLRTQKEITRSI